MGLREFTVARLVRLYPFYALSLLCLLALVAGMHLAGLPPLWSATALMAKLPFAVLMLPSPALDVHAYLYPFNIAAWSIFLELLVNVLFAIVCRQIRRPRVRWALIAGSGAALAAQLMMQDVLGGSSWNTLAAGIPRVCFSFFVGVQVHEWLKHRHGAETIHSGWSMLALAALLVVICAPEHQWLKLAAIFGIFPVLMLVLGASDVPRGIAGTALRKLGVLSYAIYMMHGPILLGWLTLYLTPSVLAQKSALIVAPILASVVVASYAADRWIDAPVRGWLTERLHSRKRAQQLAASRDKAEAA